MCTVSYIPLGHNQFVLTSNRDESPSRSPKEISRETSQSQALIFPRDIKGGTWICATSENRLVCLLNGAFLRHQHRPPYRKSRGLIVKEFFDFPDTVSFYQQYDMEGIEPFTMVVWDKGKLYQFRRDEERSYLTPLDVTQAYIWSSATLYEPSAKIKRQSWFDAWKKEHEFSPESILHLHQTGGDGDIFNDFIMNRKNIVRTVSITQVINDNDSMKMVYRDLLNDGISIQDVSISQISEADIISNPNNS